MKLIDLTHLGAGKYIIENVANAHQLPPVGAQIIALPLKIEEGAESPIRLIAMFDEKLVGEFYV